MRERIADNLARVRQRIEAACRRAGRSPDEISLVAVTKNVSTDAIRVAAELGLTDFGENRVQEARDKIPFLRDLPIRWHLVGHLQSNKARLALELFHIVHSVDSVDIAAHLSRRLPSQRILPVLLEVNVAGEQTKYGFRRGLPAEREWQGFFEALDQILALPGLDVVGLMTVAPIVSHPTEVRPVFRALRELRDQLRESFPTCPWTHLSMGMTDDFEVAIEEGATILRLGRAIFSMP